MAYSPYRDASASLLDVRHYNYQRDPQFMESERVPNISAEGMPSEADIARNRGVPPIAIPYMTLHNLDRPDGKGKRIIVPMVVGFESTFLANSLQGLLCLPGCESVFMGEPVQAGSGSRRPHGQQQQLGEDEEHNCSAAGQRRGEAMMDTNEEETGGVSMDEADTQSANSSSHQPRPAAKQEKSSGSPPRSNASSRSPSSGAGSDLNSLGPSGDADGMTNEEGGARAGRGDGAAEGRTAAGQGGDNNNRSGGGDGASASAGRVLRGGIRCHGNIRVKSAVSRAYADFVLQHLEDGEINLKTPAPRCTSTRAVTDTQLDDAGELETLRGQTPNVPRCLAPVAIPGEAPAPAGTAAEKGRVAGGEAAVLSATVLVSSAVPPMQRAASVTAAGVFAPDSAAAASLPPAQSIAVSTGSKEQRWVLPSASEHSCSDYSPTPSSNDDDGGEGRGNSQSGEERDKTAALTASAAAAAAAAGAAETRVGPRVGAEDSRRFTCFASNSIVNMPVYRFPRLESDDLAELTAFMVVRSSVQPDEAVDLDLATHVLGNPHDIERLPVELRMIMVNRAARLMKSAVFLQV